MMVDVLAQHLHLGVEEVGVGRHCLDLRDQLLAAGMLHRGFIDQVLVLQAFAGGRVEDLFLDLGVHGEHLADLRGELLALRRGSARLGELVVVLEQFLHLLMVLGEQGDRVGCGVGLACGTRRR